MKLEIEKVVRTKETVEIKLPYYFLHDLSDDNGDYEIHGKIEPARTTTIKLRESWRGYESAEVEIEDRPAQSMGCYITDAHRSTKARYLAAKARAAELLEGA